MEKTKKDTHNETKPINPKTCAVDNKSTILAGSISNTLNPESNINNNILTVNKFGIKLEHTTENGGNENENT